MVSPLLMSVIIFKCCCAWFACFGWSSLELRLWGYCRLMSSLWCSVVVFRLPLNAFFLVMVHGQTLIIKFQMPNFICHMSYVSHVKCQTDVSHVEFQMSNFRCFTCQNSDVSQVSNAQCLPRSVPTSDQDSISDVLV